MPSAIPAGSTKIPIVAIPAAPRTRRADAAPNATRRAVGRLTSTSVRARSTVSPPESVVCEDYTGTSSAAGTSAALQASAQSARKITGRL